MPDNPIERGNRSGAIHFRWISVQPGCTWRSAELRPSSQVLESYPEQAWNRNPCRGREAIG